MGLRSLPIPRDAAEPPAVTYPSAAPPPPVVTRPAAPQPTPPARSASAKPELRQPVPIASAIFPEMKKNAVAPPDEPFTAAELSVEEKIAALRAMDEKEVTGCTRCRLCETRNHTVFGEGNPDAAIFFVGEGPGETEDKTGRPFVGRAGQLLDKMIAGMGLERSDVFIANIVKCRPPGNRAPVADEVAACTPYLERQLEIVRPKVIVTLGLPASQYMLKTKIAMGKLRGKWHTWRGIKLMPTYHPAYILRYYTPEVRGAVWGDLQLVMREAGLSPLP